MKIKSRKGRKVKGDKKFYIKTDGWEPVTYAELFRLLRKLFRNEDRCYPNGEGAGYLVRAIKDVASDIPMKKILKRFKLK